MMPGYRVDKNRPTPLFKTHSVYMLRLMCRPAGREGYRDLR